MRRLVLVFLAAAAAIVLLLWPLHGALLDWDEVGYAESARLGFWAHYIERGTLSYKDFAEFVSAKREKRRPSLPEDFEEAASPIVARHIHPPLVSYLLSAVADAHDERVLRSVQLLGALALAAATIFAYACLSPTPTLTGMSLVGLASAWLGFFLFAEITMHGWTAVFVGTSAGLTRRWLDRRQTRDGLLLAGSIALCALALQTGAFLFIAVVLSILTLQETPFALRLKHVLIGTALVGAIFVALWPGSILTSAIIRIPATYAYAIARGKEYANVGAKAGMVWRSISPAVALTPLAVVSLARTARGELRRAAPYLIIGVIYTIAMTKFAIAPRYLLPGMAALTPIIGLALDRLPSSAPLRAAVFAAVLATFVPVWEVRPIAEHDEPMRKDLAWLAEHLRHHVAYVQGGHMYRHYLEGAEYDIHSIRVDTEGLLLRERGSYRTLHEADVSGTIVGIRHHRTGRVGALDLPFLAACQRTDLSTLELYDCTKLTADAGE